AIRMYTPLAPAIHLGADAILAISTRYPRSRDEASQPVISGYPPPAQVAGVLLNAIFLDAIEQDAYRLERINRLLGLIPSHQSRDLRPVRLLTPRPSRDLGRLAADYESKLPRAFRFLTRGLGTRETSSPDFLSLLMFQPDYLRQLIEIGEADAEDYLDEIHQLLE
ncbi:MAG: patatin, partial [Thermoanaerobaculia bacterium]